jgi:hypothetical protein
VGWHGGPLLELGDTGQDRVDVFLLRDSPRRDSAGRGPQFEVYAPVICEVFEDGKGGVSDAVEGTAELVDVVPEEGEEAAGLS